MRKLIPSQRYNLYISLHVCVILQNKTDIKKSNVTVLKNKFGSAGKDAVENIIPLPRSNRENILLPVPLSVAERRVVRTSIWV